MLASQCVSLSVSMVSSRVATRLLRIVPVAVALAFLCVTLFRAPLLAQQESQGTTVSPLITQEIDESQLTTLTGNTYPLARPQFDLGKAPASLPMERMLLVLKHGAAQQAELTRLLDEQQDKSSPNFHKWLTPDQFGKQFGPSDADMQTITAWLQSHGFSVGSSRGRTVLEFSGSASQVEEAFHTPIHKYVVNGEQHWANARDPQIPTALAPAVAGIVSLHNFPRKAQHQFVGSYSEKTRRLARPLPSFPIGSDTLACGSGDCYAVSPYDFATIYDVQPLWTAGTNGTGQTIAIVGRTNINPSDPTTFWQLFGLTVPANKLNIILNGPDPGINGDESEADIDIQWSGAVAPQATIDFVTSQTTNTADGIDLSAVYIIENNLAPVMSESYGECELGMGTAGNQFYYAMWGQAAAQGISVFVSTGDNGSAACDNPGVPAQFGLNVNGIASTPYNAAIGGTDFNEYNTQSTYWNATNGTNQESAKGYIPEVAWNDSCVNPWALTAGLGTTVEQVCNNPGLNPFFLNSTGGSGGPSNCSSNTTTSGSIGTCSAGYIKPSWQVATGVTPDHLRDMPDVSLFASNGDLSGSFYLICQADATGGLCDLNDLAGYGGTSVASPAFAGIMSLVNQKTGTPQGVPGFYLYQLVSKQANAFHDVPSGSTNAMPCATGSPNCVTSTNGDAYGVLSGYSTGAGYDMATGLGTVDAANLVNNWNKATFTPTTATLQLNNGTAVNVTHGAAVPVTIGINPTAATGQAALLLNPGPGTTTGQDIDIFTLSAGSASKSTSLLPGGTYNVIAHYGGDGTYGGSYSTPVSVTVAKENSTIVIPGLQLNGAATTTVNYDAQYSVQATVENAQGAACNPPPSGEIVCPTGNMTFTADGNAVGTGPYTLDNTATAETTGQAFTLTGGTHSLAAQYNGDNNYNTGSASVSITVNQANTMTAAPSFQASDFKNVTLQTQVQDPNASNNLAAPTGQVTFYSNGTLLPGTVTYTGYGYGTSASLQASFPGPGTYSITAKYSGDQNYLGSTSPATPALLQYPVPAMTITPSTQTVQAGGTASVTALVDSGNMTYYPTGTVTFTTSGSTVAGPVACTNATDTTGHFSCQAAATFTVSSSENVYASYSGDTNYPASQAGTSITVPDFSVSVGGGGSVTVTQGQSQTVAINVSPSAGFNGTVSFTCSGLPVEATCSFSPTQVTGGSGATTLTITTAALGQSRRHLARASRGTGWLASAALFMLGACLIGIPSWRRRGTLPMLIIVALFLIMPGCGGGGGGGTPPPPNNPVPTITSLSPTQQAAGSQSQTLTVNGTGLIGTSQVSFNGTVRERTVLSATSLSLSLSATDLATAGNYPVVVTNPSPGGGPSGAVNFGVVSGTPTGNFYVGVTATSGQLTHTVSFALTVQ